MNFTYDAYKGLISLIQDHYQIANYHNYDHFEKPCILRHDIDMELDKAVEMARFEYNKCEKIQATYFVLISSDFYNVFSKGSQEKIREIIGYGHEIGLHFDEVKYGQNVDVDKTKMNIIREARLLEEMIGTKVTTVSMHIPSPQILEADLEIPGLINSYQKIFFHDFKYVSDSRMHWRENVREIILSGNYPQLHVLTHPIWYASQEETTRKKLLHFCNRRRYAIYKTLDENCRDLDEFVTKNDFEI